MSEESKKSILLPDLEQVEQELNRVHYKKNYFTVLRSTVFVLIVVAAVSVLVAVLVMPILQIYGNSMNPTFEEGNFVVSVKGTDFETGDIIAFYYNNKILVKRVIAESGEWVDIKEDGTVYVNGEEIIEPYVQDKAKGECDLEFPYQVPESRVFVLGDHRSVSVDSRSSDLGCVSDEQIVGKIVFRIWPLNRLGAI